MRRVTKTTTTARTSCCVHLPLLVRDGTLLLRCPNDENANAETRMPSTTTTTTHVRIVPSMNREDVLIEVHNVPSSTDDDNDGSLMSDVDDAIGNTVIGNDFTTPTIIEPYLRVTNHPEGKRTSDGRPGSYAEVDVLIPEEEGGTGTSFSERMVVIATPEKFNIACHIHRGDISIVGGNKIEGDVHLSTSYGNIDVQSKVRGYEVMLDTTGGSTDRESDITTSSYGKGTIQIRKVIEAKTLHIRSSSRVRARMLNVGSKLSIVVSSSSLPSSKEEQPTHTKLDDDDEGALIDIGSMYIVSSGAGDVENEAQLIVNEQHSNVDDGYGRTTHCNLGLVRVKSSHGHIVVHASTSRGGSSESVSSTFSSESGDETVTSMPPLIDLGGVNGSCDILLEGTMPSSSLECCDGNDDSNYVGCSSTTTSIPMTTMRVHFDSLSTESISTITSRNVRVSKGDFPSMTSITMDRKLETEVRLLSVPSVLNNKVDANEITSEEVQDINFALMDILQGTVDKITHTSNNEKDVAGKNATTIILGSSAGDDVNSSVQQEQQMPPIVVKTDAFVDSEYAGLEELGERPTSLVSHRNGLVQYVLDVGGGDVTLEQLLQVAPS